MHFIERLQLFYFCGFQNNLINLKKNISVTQYNSISTTSPKQLIPLSQEPHSGNLDDLVGAFVEPKRKLKKCLKIDSYHNGNYSSEYTKYFHCGMTHIICYLEGLFFLSKFLTMR